MVTWQCTIWQRLHRWDAWITQKMHLPPGHPLRWLVVVGAHLGDGPLWLGLWAAGWLYWRQRPDLQRGILTWVASAILAAVVTYIIKFAVKRPRPRQVAGFYSQRYDAHAFPSGHATRMGTVALWGSALFPGWQPAFWGISLWCALSRVTLGVHYLGDVVAGFLIGALVSWGMMMVGG